MTTPGTPGLPTPPLPGTLTTPGLTPPSPGLTPTIPFFTLSEPSLDISRAQRVVLDEFVVDQYTLTAAHQSILDGAALRLKIDDVRLVLIQGHTDTTGTETYNEGLALRRAEAVRDALVERDVEVSRLITAGLGEREPVVLPERSAADRARNR